MKENNKKIFIITLICVIIATVLIQIEVIRQIDNSNNIINSNYEKIDNLRTSETGDDTKGYAMIGYGIGSFASEIAVIFFIIIDFILTVLFIIYLILYMVAWICVIKNENSKKLLLCTILYIIALVIQIIIIFTVIKFSKIILLIGGSVVLYVLFIFIQMIPIITTAILYFGNYSKYKKQYKEIEK